MPKDEFDFEDPLELNGAALLSDEDTLQPMAECFVEERVKPLLQTPMNPEDDPLFDMAKYAVKTGIRDLATNLDHYLYGHPKVTDRE